MTSEELAIFNNSLPWWFQQGSPLGTVGGGMHVWPELDERVRLALAAGLELKGKRVLETGCCEGHVSVGLLNHGAELTAFDSRLVNVVKTVVRCAAWGHWPRVVQHRVESFQELGAYDVFVHLGVLYHLEDPIGHMKEVATHGPAVVLLDTHVTEGAHDVYKEPGDLLSGMQPTSNFPRRDELETLLDSYYECQKLRNEPDHFLGPRSLYLLRRRPHRRSLIR